jgi:hypothetical protein
VAAFVPEIGESVRDLGLAAAGGAPRNRSIHRESGPRRVHHLESSHSPMLSRPRELAELIRAQVDQATDTTGATR